MPRPRLLEQKEKVRISLDVSKATKADFEYLQRRLKLTTLVDTFRKSMRMSEMILNHLDGGGKIVLQAKNGKQETLKFL